MPFINVDKLLPQTNLKQFVDHYNFNTEIQKKGKEERIRSPFPCDKCRGNQIVIAVDWQKQVFKTHCYHCDVRGSVTLLLYGMKHERLPSSGLKLKGEEFKEIAEDIAVVAGQGSPTPRTPTASRPKPKASESNTTAGVNTPLSRNPDERIRKLEHLDEQFVYEFDEVSNRAASYLNDRPYLTPDVMQRWDVGVLPQSSKSYIRGCMIYGLKNERGQRLGWAGRYLKFEEKIKKWEKSDRSGAAPIKTKFPPKFHKGSFLFGAEIDRMDQPGVKEQVLDTGLIVVEGFNDVIALSEKGVVAVGLCGNQVAEGQVDKLVRWSRELANSRVTLFLDNNVEGQNGTRQAIERLADQVHVRTIWTPESFDGVYRDVEPEQLSTDSLLALLAPVSISGVVLTQIAEATSD
jgi:5S rRNA maturation endonuclease (ribonuclease M5)